MLSSFVGAWIALGLFGVVAVMVAVGFIAKIGASSGTSVPEVKSRSVLKITLNGEIIETDKNLKPDYMTIVNGTMEKPMALNSLVTAIREAAENKNISMILLDCQGASASAATLNALRDELLAFKKSGKSIYAYADNYTMGDYYLATAADSLFVNPGGMVNLHGIGSSSIYMKELFDKLGINFQVVKVGTFKSAVEPYIMNEMSEPARAQLDTLFGSMWGYMKKQIASSRPKLTPALIDTLISNKYIMLAPVKTLVENDIVDKGIYRRTLDSMIADKIGVEVKKLNCVTPDMLVGETDWGFAYSSKKQIAVLYACGEIADGNDSQINWETLVPEIVDLADDDNVKGMVLRVNSPGGSAFGSEQIGEALDYFMSKGKPLSVSMGDYAASGGYWISSGADRIFADPLTITGSIGIFGLIPNVKGLTDKIGIHQQSVNTNPGSDFPNLYNPLNERQLAAMQSMVERGYDQFVGRVAEGRKMPEAKVRRIGEGRVWDAMTAVKIGLVDSLGGLKDAIEWTSKKAGLKDNYDVAIYPRTEPNVWDVIMGDFASNIRYQALLKAMKGDYDYLMAQFAREVLRQNKIQAHMPYFKVVI